MRRVTKAILSPFFAVIWFLLLSLGITVLIVPQLTINAYGKKKDFISVWIDFMENEFTRFEEV
jgi:membrane glycosyltransferase